MRSIVDDWWLTAVEHNNIDQYLDVRVRVVYSMCTRIHPSIMEIANSFAYMTMPGRIVPVVRVTGWMHTTTTSSRKCSVLIMHKIHLLLSSISQKDHSPGTSGNIFLRCSCHSTINWSSTLITHKHFPGEKEHIYTTFSQPLPFRCSDPGSSRGSTLLLPPSLYREKNSFVGHIALDYTTNLVN